MNPVINLIKEQKRNKNKITAESPRDVGWVEKKLTEAEYQFVWHCINNVGETHSKKSIRDGLAGNISASYELKDIENLFWKSTVCGMIDEYNKSFNPFEGTMHMNTWWVNYQNQTEFNPLHTHTGVFSFVIWMKIPTDYREQKKLPFANPSNSKTISNFVFTYTDLLGKITSKSYKMSPEKEGMMVLFPAALNHEVYPFYNCDDTRISVSGNISYCQ